MEEKLVSIIIPVYNVKPFLDTCIKSAINQTYKNIEIIIVDDGSTDGSDEICDLYATQDKRIQVVHQKNGGLSVARNTGIEKITGEYIFFLDSDDYIADNTIEIMMNSIIVEKLDIVCCNRVLFWDNGRKKIQFKQNNGDMFFNSKEAIIEMNKYHYIDMSAHSKIFKKELFEKIRFPEGKLSEDMFVMYKLFDRANKIGYISMPLLYYYQRSGSISKSKKINFDFVEAAENQLLYLGDKYPDIIPFMKGICMVANLTIYNAVIVNGGKVNKKDYSIIKNNIKKYYNKNNINELSFIRRLEIRLFLLNTTIYKIMVKIYKNL